MFELVTPPDLQANSYASLVEADDYIETYVLDDDVGDAWTALDPVKRSKLLIAATQRLDSYFCFVGRKAYFEQALQWPRYNVYIDGYYVDPTLVPVQVIRATVQMALWLQENSGAQSSDAITQFRKIEAGPLKITINDDSGTVPRQYVPDDVIAMLERYGEYALPYNGSGMRVATVYR